jgi:hypothetical protein
LDEGDEKCVFRGAEKFPFILSFKSSMLGLCTGTQAGGGDSFEGRDEAKSVWNMMEIADEKMPETITS